MASYALRQEFPLLKQFFENLLANKSKTASHWCHENRGEPEEITSRNVQVRIK